MLVWSESECCDFSIKLLWNTHEVMHQEVVSLIRIKGSCSHQLNHLGFQPSSTYLTWSTPCSSWTVHFHRSFVGQWIFSTGFFLGLAKPVGFLGSVGELGSNLNKNKKQFGRGLGMTWCRHATFWKTTAWLLSFNKNTMCKFQFLFPPPLFEFNHVQFNWIVYLFADKISTQHWPVCLQ